MTQRGKRLPLAGIRVLELGSFVAGPFCGRLLADFGAEVVKVEAPAGDQVRNMGERQGGKSLLGASIMRNKRLVALDLKSEDARQLVKRMVRTCDVVVENFRPGLLESWGLGYDDLRAERPDLIMVRISGFGQTGPYRSRPGFGVIGEAVSGLREMIGDPDRPPARVAVPLTDYVAGLYAAFGTVTAVLHRDRTGEGQLVDAALYEAAFSMLEAEVPAFAALGVVPTRTGSKLGKNTPSNLYRTRDGRDIHITALSESIFRRLMRAMGRADLISDPRFADSQERCRNEAEMDRIVADWVAGQDLSELEPILHEADVPAAPVFRMPDIFADPHFRSREMLQEVPDEDLGRVTLAGVVPKLSATPGEIRWTGGRVGRDTEQVLRELCGASTDEIARLRAAGAAVVPDRPKAAE